MDTGAEFHLKNIAGALSQIRKLLPDLEADWALIECLKSYFGREHHNNFRFAIAGAWNSGKSTLVNGILGLQGKEAQTTALAECTSIPTVVRPAETTRLLKWEGWELVEADAVFEKAFLELTPEVKALNPLLDHYLGKEWEVIREVRRPEEERSVEYLDLPGHMSGERGSQRMKESMVCGIRASDGLIYVVHGGQGLTKEDRSFIEANVPGDMPVLLVLSHLDGPGKTATDRHAVRDKLKEDAVSLLGERFMGIMTPVFVESDEIKPDTFTLDQEMHNLLDRLKCSSSMSKTRDRLLNEMISMICNIAKKITIEEGCLLAVSALLKGQWDQVSRLAERTEENIEAPASREVSELLRHIEQDLLDLSKHWTEPLPLLRFRLSLEWEMHRRSATDDGAYASSQSEEKAAEWDRGAAAGLVFCDYLAVLRALNVINIREVWTSESTLLGGKMKDPEKSNLVAKLRRAAEAGHALSQRLLGFGLCAVPPADGWDPVRKNKNKTIMTQICEFMQIEPTPAGLEVALVYRDINEGFFWLWKCVQRGDPYAAYAMINAYGWRESSSLYYVKIIERYMRACFAVLDQKSDAHNRDATQFLVKCFEDYDFISQDMIVKLRGVFATGDEKKVEALRKCDTTRIDALKYYEYRLNIIDLENRKLPH